MAENAKKIRIEFLKIFEDITRKINIDEFVRALPAGKSQIKEISLGDLEKENSNDERIGLVESVSSNIFIPVLIDSNSLSLIVINGILANAHPVATVRSAFLQIIASGAVLFDLIE